MENQSIGLLWPDDAMIEEYKGKVRLSERCVHDLGIERIVQAIGVKQKYFEGIQKVLLQLCSDPAVIRFRLDVMEDFVNNPELSLELEGILPAIQNLYNNNKGKNVIGLETVRKISWQLETLSMYVECVSRLHAALGKHRSVIQSAGLRRLLSYLDDLSGMEQYQGMVEQLPGFRKSIQDMSSVTIGINLDNELRPAEAVFLSIEPKPFKENKRSLVTSLLGLKSVNDPYYGISQFHSLAQNGGSAFETALFKDLEALFNTAIQPIGAVIQQYLNMNIQAITSLELEIAFYAGASKLVNKLRKVGLAMCKPAVLPVENRECRIRSMTDFIFATALFKQYDEINLGDVVVPNDVEFGPESRVFILTGPNQGGKTTYTRAIGAAQLLFQAGLYIPGSEASMSPVDWIFTHFSEEEKPNVTNGRLGEESKRIAAIFEKATSSSLILLNESFSSTSAADSLYLARDIVKGIKVIGCRTVFATHLLDLAAGADEINHEVPGDSKVISMVAGIEDEGRRFTDPLTKRTYKITAGPPMRMSYAKDIAQLYGISFEQIMGTLKERELLDDKK